MRTKKSPSHGEKGRHIKKRAHHIEFFLGGGCDIVCKRLLLPSSMHSLLSHLMGSNWGGAHGHAFLYCEEQN